MLPFIVASRFVTEETVPTKTHLRVDTEVRLPSGSSRFPYEHKLGTNAVYSVHPIRVQQMKLQELIGEKLDRTIRLSRLERLRRLIEQT